jgi:hypothetical protein
MSCYNKERINLILIFIFFYYDVVASNKTNKCKKKNTLSRKYSDMNLTTNEWKYREQYRICFLIFTFSGKQIIYA